MKRRRFSPSVYERILDAQQWKCACGCGETLEPGRIDWDHRIPLNLGGRDEPDNLQALVKRHHVAKTAREAREHAKWRRIARRYSRPPLNALDRELLRRKERREG